MAKIIGIIVLLGSVLGGYLLSGGKIMAIVQPFEVLIIGGAALGAFLQANPGSTFMTVLKKAPKMFSNRFTHVFYLEVLGMLYEVLNKSRREGMMAIEADVEDPAASPIFSKYPAVLKDERMTAYVCDYLRIMSSGNMAPHELEGLFDMELGSLKEDLEHPAHAVTRVADALPGGLIWSPGHVAIYAGGNMEIDAPRTGMTVQFRSIWQSSPVFIRLG